MRGLSLLAKSRNLVAVSVGVAVVAVASFLLGERRITLAYGSGTGIPYAAVLPLACACFIGIAARSSFGHFEQAVARSRPALCVTVLTLLLVLSAAAVGVATRGLPAPVSAAAAVRNLIGLTGLCLLTAAVTGSRTSWVLPCCYVVTVLSLGTGPDDGLWAWILRPDDDFVALYVALALHLVGLTALALRGAPEPAQEQ
jgi:cytochrome bd-type quinol oxidase subunit 2